MKIDPSWVAWAKDKVTLLENGGYLIFPSDGAIFQVNHKKFTLELICCKKSWVKSNTEAINKEVFAKIGYRYIGGKVPTSAETMISKILASYQYYATNISTLMRGIEIIFEVDTDKVIEKLRKKMPINPVTIRTKNKDSHNLTVGRLWIGSDSIPDTSYRFDPSKKQDSPRWDKPLTIAIWKNEDIEDMHAMVVDEDDFLQAVKKLPSINEKQMKIFGTTKHKGLEHISFVLTLKDDKLRGILCSSSGKELGSTDLSFSHFLEGLQHLFPNGELDI